MEVFSVRLEQATSLPISVKRKWEQSKEKTSHKENATLENLKIKLQAAEQRRKTIQQDRRSKASRSKCRAGKYHSQDPSHALERLEKRLAAAEAKRQAVLHAIKLRASATVKKAAEVALAEADKRNQLKCKLQQSLEAADVARAAHLATTAERAARTSRRAHNNAMVVKQREKYQAASKLASLLHRIKCAEVSREQTLVARKESAVAVGHHHPSTLKVMAVNSATTPHPNTLHNFCTISPRQRGMGVGEWLLKQAAARKIQTAWRTFSARYGTTQSLVNAFVATGIPFSVEFDKNEYLAQSPISSLTISNTNLVSTKDPPPALEKQSTASSTTNTTAAADGVHNHDIGNSMPFPSPRRLPAARLASSVAELAASPERFAPLSASMHVSSLSFDEFASRMSSPTTLRAAQAFLKRIESLLKILGGMQGYNVACLDSLLGRLYTSQQQSKTTVMPMYRYPPRSLLSAYMVVSHPEVVFSQQGHREHALGRASRSMIASFERLLSLLQNSPSHSPSSKKYLLLPTRNLKLLLVDFDREWVSYLEQFVAWKLHDAAGLESELIRAAVELETSRLIKINSSAASMDNEDMQAVVQGVDRDLSLIAERVEKLTGRMGKARIDAALAAVRAGQRVSITNTPSTPMSVATHAGSSSASNNQSSSTSSSTSSCPVSDPSLPLSQSPSQSPAKKIPRRQGTYNNNNNGDLTTHDATDNQHLQQQQHHVDAISPGRENENPKPINDDNDDSGRSNSTAPPSSSSTTTARTRSTTTNSNVFLMWQLLYDATWHLPTTEAELLWTDALGETDPMGHTHAGGHGQSHTTTTSATAFNTDVDKASELHIRVRRIAEKAFWDGIRDMLSISDSIPSGIKAVASLLVESGSGLLEVLPHSTSPVALDVMRHLGSAQIIVDRLQPPDYDTKTIDYDALFSLLEWCSTLLRRWGAPARESAALHAQNIIRRELEQAGNEPAAIASVITRGLRLISVLFKLLRLDVANAHLAILSSRMGATAQGAAMYARSKMQDNGFLGPYDDITSHQQLAVRLPHTRGWLALASGRLVHVEALVSSDTTHVHHDAKNTHANTHNANNTNMTSSLGTSSMSAGVPRRLMTGFGSITSHSNPQASPAPGLAGSLTVPIKNVYSWQGLVRCGLCLLIAGEGAVGKLNLPETLSPDAGRLSAAQSEFQHLVVLNACFLTIHTNTTVGVGGGESTMHQQRDPEISTFTMKKRLRAVLASPDVCLADVAAEVALLCNRPQDEEIVHSMLRGMLGKSSTAFRSITSGLSNALTVHLLLGPGSNRAHSVATVVLRRCGAGDLVPEVAVLAGQLAQVAAVTEAVCQPWYQILASDLV